MNVQLPTRWSSLAQVVAPVHGTPVTTDPDTAAQRFETFEGAGSDGVIAKPADLTYEPGKRLMFKVTHARTAECVVAGLRWHKSGPVAGSLLLGLYADNGELRHVGVSAVPPHRPVPAVASGPGARSCGRSGWMSGTSWPETRKASSRVERVTYVPPIIRSGVAALLVGGVLAAGCSADPAPELPGSQAPGGQTPTAEVSWRPCPETPAEALSGLVPTGMVEQLVAGVTYECATLPVPQDWDAPEGAEQFEIALLRARSDDQSDRIGSLVVNPGGPGASGVDTAVYLSLAPSVGGLPAEVTRRFDIVGFDPRGVARSSPVECSSDADLDESFATQPDPVSEEEFQEVVADTRQLAEQCAAKYGEALDYFSTRQTAHDMDAVRAAVGDDKLSYLGFSYGSLLGAVYAQLYPERIRAMVLDGAVDPEQDTIESSEGQAAGFERAFDNFAAWCEDTPDQCPIGPDARASVTEAMERAEQSPVAGEDGREATAGWILWAVISALYSQDLWPSLGAAIEQLEQGDASGVFELVDAYTGRDDSGEYPNLFDALTAVNCADDATEVSVAEVRQLQEQWREEYPMFGAPLALSVLGCSLWPAEPDPYPTGPAQGAPPILVVGTTGDPATPYESTARLAEMLGVGVVLTWEGEGHTAYPGTQCIDETVDAYLIDLTVPDDGTTCPAQ